MGIRLYREEDTNEWDRYVATSDHTTAYHQLGWKYVIERSFGHRTYYLVSEGEHGRIDGILPLVHLKSFVFGSFYVSLPYFNYGGVCADRPETTNALLQDAIRLTGEAGATHLEIRECTPLVVGLPSKSEKVSMRLELPDSSEMLWNSFPSKLRSQIRKPQKEGFSVKIGGKEELDSFYRVFARNMRQLGTPVYPKEFFQEIMNVFPRSTAICVVREKHMPVAAGFLVGFKDTLEIPWASSLREYNRLAPNMLLYWSVLSFASEQGYKVFDFGRSTPGEGTYHFKAQWGATPVPLYWYYWMRDAGPLPEINPRNRKYRIAIEMWKRLPLVITQVVGPRIVRNIP